MIFNTYKKLFDIYNIKRTILMLAFSFTRRRQMKYVLVYAQPRLSRKAPDTVIFEKRTVFIEIKKIRGFLKAGHVMCGGVMYRRFRVSAKSKEGQEHIQQIVPGPNFLNWVNGSPLRVTV